MNNDNGKQCVFTWLVDAVNPASPDFATSLYSIVQVLPNAELKKIMENPIDEQGSTVAKLFYIAATRELSKRPANFLPETKLENDTVIAIMNVITKALRTKED